MKVGLPKVLNIVSKLIGQELASVTPNTEETNNNIKWSNEEKGQTTEEDELWKKFERNNVLLNKLQKPSIVFVWLLSTTNSLNSPF